MTKKSIWNLLLVSVDFSTLNRPQPPYQQLEKLLTSLGGVFIPTLQIRLLLTMNTTIIIRNRIRAAILGPGDRVFVGKIVKGEWHNLHKVSDAKLRRILKTYATEAKLSSSDMKAAFKALSGLLPR